MEVFVYLTVVLAIVLLAVFGRMAFMSFRSQSPKDYLGLGPDLDLRVHLSGRNICEGVIYGPTGRVTSRFAATMTGHWTGPDGVVEVEFRYDGGNTQNRAWHLNVTETGLVRAEADDVEGVGHGQIVGPALQLKYKIVLPEDAGGHTLSVIDWMYLTEGGTILNRSQFRKGGLLVAELVATIRKQELSS